VKLTKRFSHNFDLSYSFTFQKEMTMGSELSYQIYGTINPQVNDTFNRDVNKYISGLSRPFMATTYGATPTYIKGTNLTASGFGYINMAAATVASGVRTGQIVARFSF
jgi:hypothetical protein